jgi:hypothetical protein
MFWKKYCPTQNVFTFIVIFVGNIYIHTYIRWEDNIKMDLQGVGGGCGDWMELAQDRYRWRALVITVKNLRVP